MTVGRISKGKVNQSKSDYLQSQSGEDIVRQARLAHLRALVVSGRYKVEPTKLAMSILARAFQHGGAE